MKNCHFNCSLSDYTVPLSVKHLFMLDGVGFAWYSFVAVDWYGMSTANEDEFLLIQRVVVDWRELGGNLLMFNVLQTWLTFILIDLIRGLHLKCLLRKNTSTFENKCIYLENEEHDIVFIKNGRVSAARHMSDMIYWAEITSIISCFLMI